MVSISEDKKTLTFGYAGRVAIRREVQRYAGRQCEIEVVVYKNEAGETGMNTTLLGAGTLTVHDYQALEDLQSVEVAKGGKVELNIVAHVPAPNGRARDAWVPFPETLSVKFVGETLIESFNGAKWRPALQKGERATQETRQKEEYEVIILLDRDSAVEGQELEGGALMASPDNTDKAQQIRRATKIAEWMATSTAVIDSNRVVVAGPF